MRAVSDSLIAVLEGGGLTVGDGIGGTIEQGAFVPFSSLPFVVVYPSVKTRDGSLAESFSDVDQFYEVSGQGSTREQSEWVLEKVEALIAASALVVTEMTTTEVVRDDQTAAPSRFRGAVRARIRSYAPTGA